MIVTTHPVQLVLPMSKIPRTKGVHLSAVIRCIAKETGILEMEPDEDLSLADGLLNVDAFSMARISMGLAWEEWYIQAQLPEVVDHPGEVEVDGIYMTPDGEELTTYVIDRRERYGLKLHEIKCTYKSINTVCGTRKKQGELWQHWLVRSFNSEETPIGPMSSQFMWLAQTKAYCRAKGTRFVDQHVLFVCGDYSWPQRPVPLRFSIEFTEDELDTNWQLMTDYRDTFLSREAV